MKRAAGLEMKKDCKRIPAFFKVFLPQTSSKRLQIPLAFGTHMKGIPKKAYLRDIKGNIWPIEVAKYGDEFFFQDGWVEFVEQNGVEEAEFLVFQFDGNNVFYFKLYGKNMCEKRHREAFDLQEKEEKVVEEEQNNRHEEVVRRTDDEHNQNDDDIMDGDNDNVGNDDNLDVEEEKEHTEEEDNAKVDDDVDIFKSGRIVPPNNPFFVAKIKRSRRNELSVPLDVIRDYNIELTEKIILCDTTGRRWSSRVCKWKDGRTWITRGWRRFCKWHNLREEDRCICEFVGSRGQIGTMLMVHVIRPGSWLS